MKARLLLLSALIAVGPACNGRNGGSGRGSPGPNPPPVPVLSGVAPADAPMGSEIQISGTGFGSIQGSSSVTVSGIAAVIVDWTDTQIRANVPSGATSGAVLVWVAGISSNPGHVGVLWPAGNVAICTIAGGQFNPDVTPDGAGGAIIAWIDIRSGAEDIYAQRVDSTGAALWTAGGVPICTAAPSLGEPRIVPDGFGGAVIAWRDQRNGNWDVFAQRVNDSGVVQWAANGVALCTAADIQNSLQMVSDGSGGAIVVWMDYRSGTNNDIYAQRVNGAGTPLWTADGVPLCTTASNQQSPQITTDGAGGAIFVWQDLGGVDVYAQRVNDLGAVQWAVNGVAISTAPDSQTNPQIASDGSGGAIMVWADRRSGATHIYGQRIDGSGVTKWTPDGQAICTAAVVQLDTRLVSDGSGGAIIVWDGVPSPPGENIYAQRVDGSGALLWATDGVSVCTLAADQRSPRVVPDGQGGAVVAWFDLRSGTVNDIYAQRLNALGVTLWTSGGVAVRTVSNTYTVPSIAPDGAGGAIIVWEDQRVGAEIHLYAQGISPGGLQ